MPPQAPQLPAAIGDVRRLEQRDPSTLSDQELTLVLLSRIRDQTLSAIRQPEQAQPQAGPLSRFASGVNQTLVQPAAQLIGTAARAVTPGMGQANAAGELLQMGKGMLTAPFSLAARGGAAIGSALEPGTATSQLTPRGQLGMGIGYEPAENVGDIGPLQAQQGVSTSQRVNQGLGGVLDIGTAAASLLPAARSLAGAGTAARMATNASSPMVAAGLGRLAAGRAGQALARGTVLPAARMPSERAQEGDIAGAMGSLAGLAAPEIPPLALRGLKRVQRPLPAEMVEVSMPDGSTRSVPITRGEQGGLIQGILEPFARGSKSAGKAIREGDARRMELLTDEIATDIVQQVSADSRTVSGAGASLRRALEHQQEVLDQVRPGLDAAERAVTQIMPEFVPESLREFAATEAELRGRMMKEVAMPGEGAAVRELRSLAGEDPLAALADEIAQLPEEIRPQVEAALRQQAGAPGVAPMSTDVALKLMKLYGERTQAASEAVAPGVQGGTLKKIAGLLREDFDNALLEVDPNAYNMLNSQRRQFATVLDRINDKATQQLVGANSEATAAVLENIDVRKINRIRAIANQKRAGAFDAAAARLLEEKFLDMTPEGRLPETNLPESFRARQSPQERTLRARLEPLFKAGRGEKIYGPQTMRSIGDFVRVFDRVAESTKMGVDSNVSRMIDAAATFRTAGAVGAIVGAPLGIFGSPAAGIGAAAAALGPAVALRVVSRLAYKSRGGLTALQKMAQNMNNPSMFAFWAARLGEQMERDPEIRRILQGGGQEPQAGTEGQR